MKIVITESQIDLLNEFFGYRRNTDTFPSFIREQLKLIYGGTENWGSIDTEYCKTNVGVLNVFPHSEHDKWSILNRFDTNSNVKKRMEEIFLKETGNKTVVNSEFTKWISDNRKALMGPISSDSGKYTPELVDLNEKNIKTGNENEEYSIEVLKQRFPNSEVERFCSGDIRDTKKGMDLLIKYGDKEITVQVKPFQHVKSFISQDGDTFFEVKSYLDTNKYSTRNVSIFMFVSTSENRYILFANNKNKISQMRGNIIRFYEPPLYSNFTEQDIPTKTKRQQTKSVETAKVFDQQSEILKNLYFRKEQIELLIQKELKKIEREERKNKRLGQV
jgi:hypothetical protein